MLTFIVFGSVEGKPGDVSHFLQILRCKAFQAFWEHLLGGFSYMVLTLKRYSAFALMSSTKSPTASGDLSFYMFLQIL